MITRLPLTDKVFCEKQVSKFWHKYRFITLRAPDSFLVDTYRILTRLWIYRLRSIRRQSQPLQLVETHLKRSRLNPASRLIE